MEEKEIIKARETRKRELEKSLKTNEYWLSSIQSALLYGTSLSSVNKEKYIDQISSEEMQKIAKECIDINEYLQVVLFPESSKK